MAQPRHLISQYVAVAALAIAAVLVTVAIATRSSPQPVREIVVQQTPPPPDAATPAIDAPIDAPAIAAPVPMPPKIEGVKVKAQVNTRGVEVMLDVAIRLAREMDTKHEYVHVKASCLVEGAWFGTSRWLRMTRVPAGMNVVQQQLTFGEDHTFTTPPTLCLLGFEYTSWYPSTGATKPWRAALAKLCWDGKDVLDKPCALPKPAVRMRVDALHAKLLRGGSSLEVSVDAELHEPLDGWMIEVAAVCVLADGSTQSSETTMYTRDVRAGRPFTSKTYLFGLEKMPDVPRSCTVNVQLADRQQLVREPVSAWCWRDGNVASGACRP